MNSKLSIQEVKVLEQAVLKQLSKDLPKVVKAVVRGRLNDLENFAQGVIVQNNVKKPKAGDPAFIVWTAFDALQKQGIELNPVVASRLAIQLKQEPNVVVLDLYLWRKFHGMVS